MSKAKLFFVIGLVGIVLTGAGCQKIDNKSKSEDVLLSETQISNFLPQEENKTDEEKARLAREQSKNDAMALKKEIASINESNTVFTKSDKYGYYGTIDLVGYVILRKHSVEPFGPPGEGKQFDYAYFKLVDGLNASSSVAYDFIKDWDGNEFVLDDSIGLGCYNADNVETVNFSEKGTVADKITGEDFRVLVEASKVRPVKLRMTKMIFTGGGDAPNCYSHFRNFKIIK